MSSRRCRPQRIRVSIDLNVGPRAPDATDTADTVLSYENIVKATRAIVATGHFHLIETLAEKIAAECLNHYTVRVGEGEDREAGHFPGRRDRGDRDRAALERDSF